MPLCAHGGDIPFEHQYGKHMLAAPNTHQQFIFQSVMHNFFSQQVEKRKRWIDRRLFSLIQEL